MQKRNKNNSSEKIEIHQFKSNFFIGDDNNFKACSLKSFSKVDLDTENVTIIHFNKPPVIVPNKLFIKDNLNKYLSTNYELSNNLSVSYDETTNKLIYIVYEKKNNLETILNKNISKENKKSSSETIKKPTQTQPTDKNKNNIISSATRPRG